MKRLSFFVLTCCIGLVLSGQIKAEDLPRGSSENCFYIMPIFEQIRASGALTLDGKRQEVSKMKAQLGYGNLYHQLGFSCTYSPSSESEVRPLLQILQDSSLHIGLIFALQSHTRNDLRAVANKDFRLFQWRKDGIDWKGAFTNSGTLEVAENERDYKVPTPSRYAKPLISYNAIQAKAWAESVKSMMTDFPGVITCINGPIEEELAIGGNSNTNKLADYSPYAITEFRDWLRHSGLYDDTSGKFKGEGASALIIGDLINFNGTLRSQFYDDPTPADNNGTGVSFNKFFGTNFTTWSLRYWDLNIYPAAITDTAFVCTPKSGMGFCTGGFDAPRTISASSKFWRSWSYDTPDQSGTYPKGNPKTPAFGFRQDMVRNYVRDLFDEIASVGIPRNLMYAHQIPGEALGDFTGGGGRNRSSASTVWTGFLEKSQTVGITRFAGIDPTLMTQYANDWGIFEWHPLPNADPASSSLYNAGIAALKNYYTNKCHYLFPGWWTQISASLDATFPLNDSRFADAIHDFMKTCTEVPYKSQGTTHDYTPPQVTGLIGKIDENNQLNLIWNERIWSDLVQKWGDWSQFDSFEVQKSTDGINWTTAGKTAKPSFSSALESSSIKVRVRAISKTGLYGNWSDVVSLTSQVSTNQLNIRSEYSSLYADPGMNNKITVSWTDPLSTLDLTKMSVAISGEGQILNSTPENTANIEKFWPMNSSSELTSIYRIDNAQFSDGLFQGVVSATKPIDPYFYFTNSKINGAQLPYIAFRLYSDIPSTGQVFWFFSGGNKTVTFPVSKGWNVYSFSNLPDWIVQTAITSVRLDPGIDASAKIGLDWFAISSQPISSKLMPSVSVQNKEATFITTPTTTPGGYTVTASLDKLQATTTVQTLSSNQIPTVAMLTPSKDTIVELGTTVSFMAEPNDVDGQVNYVNFLANDSLIQKVTTLPYLYEWTPSVAGNYNVIAQAVDNAGGIGQSAVKNIKVVEQQPYSGTAPSVPGLIEAEDYDIGGDSISFCDQDLVNQGGAYRSDPVDIGEKTDGTSGYYVGWTLPGEWLEYSINVKEGMKADIGLSIACKADTGEIHLELNDEPVTNHLFIGETGGDQKYKTFSFKDVYLPEGIQKLKVVIDTGDMNIDNIRIGIHDTTTVNVDSLSSKNLIFPNPAHNQITVAAITSQKIMVQIYSLQGQIVKSYQVSPGVDNTHSVSDLPNGIYIVSCSFEGKTFRTKLIKQ